MQISGKNSNDNNLIRNNIIKYFPERDCITLVRPVEQESDLQRLMDIPVEKLKTNFKLEFKQLKDKVYKETAPKKINGKKLTGPTLAQLIIEFVNTINSGSIPNINNSWDSVINKDIKDYYDKALLKFRVTAKKWNNVMDQDDLVKNIYDAKLESLLIYNKLFYLNSDTFANNQYLTIFIDNKEVLEEEMLKIEKRILDNNTSKSQVLCKDILKEDYKEVRTIYYK